MKLKTSQTITTEVDVELPFYTIHSGHFYKIISENKVIQIRPFKDQESISVQSGTYCALNWFTQTTEKEFNEVFDRISARIHELLSNQPAATDIAE